MKAVLKCFRAIVAFPVGDAVIEREYIVYNKYKSTARTVIEEEGEVTNPNKTTAVMQPIGRIKDFGGRVKAFWEIDPEDIKRGAKLHEDHAPAREAQK